MSTDTTGDRAIVLLSGGLDSATTLHVALEEGFTLTALSFDYGQRHATELTAAATIAKRAGVAEHRVIHLDPQAFRGSALTDPGIAVPMHRPHIGNDIPATYVPARNIVFLAYALGIAENQGARDIFLGVNQLDSSGYPDCRGAFLEAFERAATLGTRSGVSGQAIRIHAPLLDLTKDAIIRRGLKLGVDYSLTRSCYAPDGEGRACGGCDACQLRLAGFRKVGIADPAPYKPSS